MQIEVFRIGILGWEFLIVSLVERLTVELVVDNE